MAYRRTSIAWFALGNRAYVNSLVTFYKVDPVTKARLPSLVTLYDSPTSGTTQPNPQTLDGDGRFTVPIYVDEPVVAVISGAEVGSHETGVLYPLQRSFVGPWVASKVYRVDDIVTDGAAGANTLNLYSCAIEHTSGTWATDLAAARWDLMAPVGPAVTAGNAAVAASASATSSATSAAASAAIVAAGVSALTGGAVISEFPFSGTGAQTVYLFGGVNAPSPGSILVSIDGVTQPNTAYSYANVGPDMTITFSEAVPSGATGFIKVLGVAAPVPVTDRSIEEYAFTGTGAQTLFTFSGVTAPSAGALIISIGGVIQPAGAYSYVNVGANLSITFSEAPPNGIAGLLKVIGYQVPIGTVNANMVPYLPSGTGAVWRTAFDKLGEAVSVKDFGAKGDGATNDTTAIQAAIATGKQVYLPAGTYMVSGLTLLSGSRLVGDGMTKTTIKLINGANAHVIAGNNTSNTYLADFKVDGNKINQTNGAIIRGVYYVGGGTEQIMERVWIDAVKDHGYASSVNTGSYQRIIDSVATNCGSAEHMAAGGPGGTGIACGGVGTRIIRCHAHGNYLNGFKCGSAFHEDCYSYNNGSGYESGFIAEDKHEGSTYLNCHAWNVVTGHNHQGQGDYLTIQGGIIRDCTTNGIRLVGPIQSARITGVKLKNCGGTGTRVNDQYGPDAIGIYTNSGAPDHIIIDDCEMIVDDGISTADRFAVYIENSPGLVHIGKRNKAVGYNTAVYVSDYTKNVTLEGFAGVSGHYTLPAPFVHTGTTTTTDLASRTVKFRELLGRRLRLTAHGTVTGTAGTKLIRVAFGGTSLIVINQIAAEAQQWSIDADITSTSTPEIRAIILATEQGGTSDVFPLRAAPGSVDVTFSLNCTLGSAADTVTLTDFRLRTLE